MKPLQDQVRIEDGKTIKLKPLPKDQIEIKQEGDYILASLYENEGYRWWDRYEPSDLPNDLISLDDLKRFGINISDIKTAGSE